MFTNGKKRVAFLLAVWLILTSFLVGCAQKNGPTGETGDKTETGEEIPGKSHAEEQEPVRDCVLTLEKVAGDSLHTDLQKAYLDDAYRNVSKYASGVAELSAPKAVTFRWSAECYGYDSMPSSYRFFLSESEDFTDAYEKVTQKSGVTVTNLKINTRYYWKVIARLGGREFESDVASFVTERTGPRTLNVPGVANVRDLGGYLTDSGKRIKQGLLIRCGRLNENNTVSKKILPSGESVFLNDLKIRTEIDLRAGGENGSLTESPLGPAVSYRHVPMSAGSNILTENTSGILEAFHVLADERNYPIIFHCSIGTDRTGMLAFLILGLCGADEETIYRDYLFSNFANIGGSRSTNDINKYKTAVAAGNEGKSLRGQVVSYLLGIGVPQAEIDSVYRILVG